MRHDVAVRTPLEAVTEILGGYQAEEKRLPFNFNPMFSLPPAGTCTVYSVIGDLTSSDSAIIPGMTPPTSRALTSGSITVSGAKGSKTAQKSEAYPGISGAPLSSSIPLLPVTNTAFLDPGSFLLALAAGADIAAASSTFNVASPFTWNSRDQIASVTRSNGIALSWSGGDANASVVIAGMGADLPSNSSSIFLCIVAPGTGSFTVPADILANLPAARPRAIQSKGALYVGQWNIASPASLSGSGLDFSSIIPASISGKTVTWK